MNVSMEWWARREVRLLPTQRKWFRRDIEIEFV
jgi:hypothetical protein